VPALFYSALLAQPLSVPGAATAASGDWTRWKFDAANTGVNPYETRLGPGNVRGLRRTWFRDQCCVGTPLVAGGMVYVSATEPGLEGPGAVTALDAATGETRWSTPTGSPEGPAGLVLAGGRLLASLGFEAAGNPMLALDAATGRPRWSGLVEFTGDESAVTAPVVAHGVVYATTVDNRAYAFSSAGCSATTCRPLWSAEINPEEYSTASRPLSVSGGAVYASAHPTGLSRWAVPTAG
jgi:outer membrane protein assembly factor BamB